MTLRPRVLSLLVCILYPYPCDILSIDGGAAEIAQTIRQLKTAMDRPGTIKQSRRSRHVG